MVSKANRWSDEELAHLRGAVKNCTHKEIAQALGRSINAVRGRCHILGLVDKSDDWTEEQIDRLKEAYRGVRYGAEINLDSLAVELGRHKSLVCRKARQFGLTDQGRDMLPPEVRKIRKPMFSSKAELSIHISKRVKEYIAEKGHPRGALGMKHTPEAKAAISKKSSERWCAMTKEQQDEHIVKTMKGREVSGTMQTMNRANSSWGAGWREIGGVRKYYRSKWEANYARYLEWLRVKGQIDSWLHEPETFWFEGIKRGCMSYLPDFRVVETSGKIVFHEVKGWMDDRSKTKIKRMAKYHPTIKLLVIDAKAYKAIKKVMQPIIKEWEVDSKGR
jgi:hypothetical protein